MPIEFLLGMAVEQNSKAGTVNTNIEMAIAKFAHGILTPEELVKSADVNFLMLSTSTLLRLTDKEVSAKSFDYFSIVGSLIHIAEYMRPDIAVTVSALSRYSLAPGKAHVRAARRVVMYLYNTRNLGNVYRRPDEPGARNSTVIHEGAKGRLDNGLNHLQVFAGSGYAGDVARRSTYGRVIMINGGPIARPSALGKAAAMSTCEAEIYATVMAVIDAVPINRLLKDLELVKDDRPLGIAEDNAACIAQENSGIKHVRNTKHYEVRLRLLQQKVADKKKKNSSTVL